MAVGYHDYYETLGVPRDAGSDDIRRAYRKLVRKYHPDVNKEADADGRFQEIAEAYDVLRDPEKRAAYDKLGSNWRAGQDVSGAQGFPDGFGDVHFDYGRGGHAQAGYGGYGAGDFGAGGDFSDFFENLFGAGARPGASHRAEGFGRRPRRGADHESVLDLTLEEAAAHGHRRIALSDGRSYDLAIPVGVRDGQRIRLAGEGGPGVDGGPSGDLLLRVRFTPHPRFRVEGNDLYVDLQVSPSEAALGARVPVPTLGGTARVRVPGGSSSGRRLRLGGEGMPAKDGKAGDLYATVQIVVPKELDDRQRELYEQLAAASSAGDPREVS